MKFNLRYGEASRKASAAAGPRCMALLGLERQKARSVAGLAISGSPTWARTRDTRINSPLLYRLSYRGMSFLRAATAILQEWRILRICDGCGQG